MSDGSEFHSFGTKTKNILFLQDLVLHLGMDSKFRLEDVKSTDLLAYNSAANQKCKQEAGCEELY